jgi:NAD(P)-dependent dehydrogenase (short-subunit alcohol dehydrogenase family)
MGMVVVVTGASAGVGRAVVREFARRGASVGLIARGMDGLEGAKREVEELGGRAVIAQADVADEVQVERAADLVERELGPIDVWVNDAMVSVFAPIDQLTADELRRVTDVTYLGTVWGTLAALRRMKPRDRGVIVQVGSALAYRAIPLQAAYCAAKHAVKGFTQSLRTELLHEKSGVEVAMVDLPAVNTPQFDWSRSRMPRRAMPVPPIYQPEVIARAIVETALSPRRQRIVCFPTLKAIAAERISPNIADHYLAKHGVDAQMTDEPTDPLRADNLFAPLPGDRGAHGRFDACARNKSSLERARPFAIGALSAAIAGTLGALAVRIGARQLAGR